MKKKYKVALMGALLVPCMVMATACTTGISMTEYNEKVADSAVNYYKNKEDGNMTITNKSVSSSSWVAEVVYGEQDEHSLKADFTAKIERTQTFEILRNNGLNFKVTEVEKTTETGKEENDEENGLKDFSTIEEVVTITTFVKNTDSWKAYTSETVTVDGKVESTDKEIYTFISDETYQAKIESVLEEINDNILEEGFFTNSMMLLKLYDAKIDYYKDGNTNFGVKGGLEMSSVNNKAVNKVNMNYEVSFKDNLPKNIVVNSSNSVVNNYLDNAQIIDTKATFSQNVEFNYSCNEISAPADFENADTAVFSPSITVYGVELSI